MIRNARKDTLIAHVLIAPFVALDNAGRWRMLRKLTWPLLWPVTALVLNFQLLRLAERKT